MKLDASGRYLFTWAGITDLVGGRPGPTMKDFGEAFDVAWWSAGSSLEEVLIFESVNMPATTAYVELLPTFRCRIEGEVVSLPEALRSLLVTVILEKGVGRRTVQRRLWPDEPQVAAAKRMRQLLWRLNRATSGKLLKIDTEFIRLGDSVGVDLFEADLKVRALLDFTGAQTGRREHWRFLDLPLLCGWPAEAICAEQERWDCLRMLGL